MKILIAGLGSIGRRHLRNLIALGEEDIVLYRSHRSSLPDEELKDFPVETDFEAALAHRPQAVIISNPTALHLEVAIPAALAGCHILMEKPVSHSLEHIDILVNAVDKSGSRILIGYQFRFHPGLQQIKKLLDEGAIGRPYSAHAHWGEYLPGWHPWEDYRHSYSARSELGGGVILTLSHPLDYLRWLLGEVVNVNARMGHLSALELDVEDYAEILMGFANGSSASVHLDYFQQPPSHTLEITCENGRVCWDNADGKAQVYRAQSGAPTQLTPPEGFERNQMFLEEMAGFVRLCRGESLPHCSLADGIRVQELVLAAKQSAAQDGGLVWLS